MITINDILINPERKEDSMILTILMEADAHCNLLKRAYHAAKERHLPMPNSPEALLSYLLFLAGQQEAAAVEAVIEANTEDEPYDVFMADDLAENWQELAQTRHYIIQLFSIGVTPASIEWEPKEKEDQQGEKDYTIPFTVKGSITTSSSSYAAARQQISEILDNLHLDLRDKQEIREYILDDILLDGDD